MKSFAIRLRGVKFVKCHNTLVFCVIPKFGNFVHFLNLAILYIFRVGFDTLTYTFSEYMSMYRIQPLLHINNWKYLINRLLPKCNDRNKNQNNLFHSENWPITPENWPISALFWS